MDKLEIDLKSDSNSRHVSAYYPLILLEHQ